VYKLCYLILLTISSVKHAVRSPDLFTNCYSAEKKKYNLSRLLNVICKTVLPIRKNI